MSIPLTRDADERLLDWLHLRDSRVRTVDIAALYGIKRDVVNSAFRRIDAALARSEAEV